MLYARFTEVPCSLTSEKPCVARPPNTWPRSMGVNEKRPGGSTPSGTRAASSNLELLDQPVQHGLEVAAQVEALRLVAADLLNGPRDDPRRFHAAEGLGVQQGPVG